MFLKQNEHAALPRAHFVLFKILLTEILIYVIIVA